MIRHTWDGLPVAGDRPHGAMVVVRRPGPGQARTEYLMLHRAHHGPDHEGERKYGPRIDGTSPTRVHVLLIDGRASGFIQHYHLRDYPGEHAARGEPPVDPRAGQGRIRAGPRGRRGIPRPARTALHTEPAADLRPGRDGR